MLPIICTTKCVNEVNNRVRAVEMTKVHQIIAENKLETPFDIAVENFYYNGTAKRDAVKISDITMLDTIVDALLKKFGAK